MKNIFVALLVVFSFSHFARGQLFSRPSSNGWSNILKNEDGSIFYHPNGYVMRVERRNSYSGGTWLINLKTGAVWGSLNKEISDQMEFPFDVNEQEREMRFVENGIVRRVALNPLNDRDYNFYDTRIAHILNALQNFPDLFLKHTSPWIFVKLLEYARLYYGDISTPLQATARRVAEELGIKKEIVTGPGGRGAIYTFDDVEIKPWVARAPTAIDPNSKARWLPTGGGPEYKNELWVAVLENESFERERGTARMTESRRFISASGTEYVYRMIASSLGGTTHWYRRATPEEADNILAQANVSRRWTKKTLAAAKLLSVEK